MPPEKIYEDPTLNQKSNLRSREIDESYQRAVAVYQTEPKSLGDETLQHFSAVAEDAKESFGYQLIARARELGLVNALQPAEAKRLTNLHDRVDLVRYMRSANLFRQGWKIFGSAEDEKGPILLAPTHSDDGTTLFEALPLDKLNSLDPNFLQEQILKFHKHAVMAHLANFIRYNIRLQSVPEHQVLPRYLTALEEIPDDETKTLVRKHMRQYLHLVDLAQPGHPHTLQEFLKQAVKVIDIGDRYTTTIQGYLISRMDHPAQSMTTQQRAAAINHTFNMLMDFEETRYIYSAANQDLPKPAGIAFSEVSAVLRNPGRYTYHLDPAEVSVFAIQEQNSKIAGYYSAVAEVTDPQQVEELLQSHLPDFYQTLADFKAWVGTDYSGKSRYETFIKDVAHSVQTDTRLKKDPLQSLDEAIKRQLRLSIGVREPFSGISMQEYSDKITFHNPHLAMVLPMLIVKRLQSDLLSQIGTSYQRPEDLRELAQSFKQLEPSLQVDYTQKYCQDDTALVQRLQQIQSDRAILGRFVNALNISKQEIDKLTQIAKGYDEYAGESYDSHTFSIVFSLLYFEKIVPEARESVQSPAFKELLKALYPYLSDEEWDQYWSLAASR